MIEKFYSCTLLSDVVVNASLATEGNMNSLDYIPGSSFMGIVANSLYKEFNNREKDILPILHEGKVRFGDATIAINGRQSLPMPLQFFTDKEKKDLKNDPVYLGYAMVGKEVKDDHKKKIQPQQVRSGYFSLSEKGIDFLESIPKKFSLKSAHNRQTRTANDSQMFGLEALPRNTQLIFSIQYENPDHIPFVEKHLIEEKRLGKSKSAEYGQVKINELKKKQDDLSTFDFRDGVLVYAASNLCFYDKVGMPSYQPIANDLGLENGEICWEKSQIRTFDYATWNTTRQTTNSVRYCIARGSVFYVKGAKTAKKSDFVGEWQTEGLGKVVYNPSFLKGDLTTEKSAFSKHFKKLNWEDSFQNKVKSAPENFSTPLLSWLERKVRSGQKELEFSNAVHQAIYGTDADLRIFDKVTSSQWGQIRQLATAASSKEELALKLFNNPKKRDGETDGQHKARKGHLMHGVAFDKIWSKNKNAPVKKLKSTFEIEMDDNPTEQSRVMNAGKSKEFIELFAAEMAHRYIRMKNKQKNG